MSFKNLSKRRTALIHLVLTIGVVSIGQLSLAMDPPIQPSYQIQSELNLSSPEVLQEHLSEEFRDRVHMNKASDIVKRTYETRARSISNTSYGLAFPMNPELLGNIMKQAKNKTILEIAGASGENSILLAFAGAEKVYMNDIDPGELSTFENLKNTLPTDVSMKLESLPGDCFKLLDKKPELSKSMDIILCRNLIHFFSDTEQSMLFNIVKKLLKPNGIAFFTSNAVYHDPNLEQICMAHPKATRFKFIQGLITDYSLGTMPCDIFYREINPVYEDIDCLSYQEYRLYQRDEKTAFKWVVDNQEFKKMNPQLQKSINQAFNEKKSEISKIQLGSVRILINHLRVYNIENFKQLFINNGFIVDNTYLFSYDGHSTNVGFSNHPHGKRTQIVGSAVRLTD